MTSRTSRAAPMSPDDRRRAIVLAVRPLLVEHGDIPTTRMIAEAAGIAEGTIFRVFPDKHALLMAVAEETLNPSDGGPELAAALGGATDLRTRVHRTAELMFARSEQVVAVMMALRRHRMAQGPPEHAEHQPRPPEFFAVAYQALLDRLTDVFEPHRDELDVTPRRAALLLRTLVLSSRHPGGGAEDRLTPAEVTHVLLDGIHRPATSEGD